MNKIKMKLERDLPNTHHTLCSILSQNFAIKKQSVESLLDAIDAAHNLIALVRVASNLLHVLPWLKQITLSDTHQTVLFPTTIDEWIDVCIKIQSNSAILGKILPDTMADRDGRYGPLWGTGIIPIHPTYAALWSIPCTECASNLDVYRMLQAHILHAHILFNSRSHKIHRHILSASSRLLRVMTWDAKHCEILEYLPAGSVTDCQRRLKALLPMGSPPQNTIEKQAIILERLLAYVLGERQGRWERGKTPRPLKRVTERKIVTSQSRSKDKYYLIQHSSQNFTKHEALLQAGCAPGEIFDEPEMAALYHFSAPNRGSSRSFLAQVMVTKNKLRHIESANQDMPLAWKLLSIAEIIEFWDLLYKIILPGAVDPQTAEAIAFAAVIFWTSSPAKRALRAKLCSDIKALPKSDKGRRWELCYCIKERCWAIRNPDLPSRRGVDAEWADDVEPINDYVLLPVTNLCHKILAPWLDNMKGAGSLADNASFFLSDRKSLESCLTKLMRGYRWHRRVTTQRLQSYLFQLIITTNSDPADAALIFGRIPPSGYATPLYYYAPETAHLRRLYVVACRSVEDIFVVGQDSTFNGIQTAARTGSQICPRPETIIRLVDNLTEELHRCRKDRYNPDKIVHIHNAYTCYTAMMIWFVSGYRAVRDPLNSLAEFDPQTGFLVISDKDSNDHYHSHIVWLPEICCRQIKAYEEHKYCLGKRLQDKRIAQLLSEPAGQGTQGTNNTLGISSTEKLPFLFFLKNGGDSVVHVAPATLSQHISQHFPLPINVNRHYLRTRLRELGVAAEYVDAWLGHWERGREPFGRYSSLSPYAIKNAIEEALSSLIDQAGWRYLRGFRCP